MKIYRSYIVLVHVILLVLLTQRIIEIRERHAVCVIPSYHTVAEGVGVSAMMNNKRDLLSVGCAPKSRRDSRTFFTNTYTGDPRRANYMSSCFNSTRLVSRYNGKVLNRMVTQYAN